MRLLHRFPLNYNPLSVVRKHTHNAQATSSKCCYSTLSHGLHRVTRSKVGMPLILFAYPRWAGVPATAVVATCRTRCPPLKRPDMVAKGVLVSAVVGVALNHAPPTACFSNVAVASAGRGRAARAEPHSSSRWCSSQAAQGRGLGVGSTAALLRLRAVEEPAAAAASEREPDAIDLDIETQVHP